MSSEGKTTDRKRFWKLAVGVLAATGAVVGFTADIATVDTAYINPPQLPAAAPASESVSSNASRPQAQAADINNDGPTLQAFVRYGAEDWSTDVPAVRLGGSVEVLLSYRNQGAEERNVTITASWPEELGDAPLDTIVTNGNYPNGYQYTDPRSIVTGGIDIGSYAAGIGAYVRMDALVADSDFFACGDNYVTFRFELTSSLGEQHEAQAAIRVQKACD